MGQESIQIVGDIEYHPLEKFSEDDIKTVMDQANFMQHFLTHREMLFAFLLSIVRDQDVAEDLFQEVSMIAFKRCFDFKHGTNFGAWLREIGRRCILKARNRRAKELVLLEPEAIEAIAAAHEHVRDRWWQHSRDALEECLEKLSARSKNLLELRYEENLRFDVIAERIRSTAHSVEEIISRIRIGLRRCIEARISTEPVK